ncbi:hypothetical protein HDU77_011769 [Chytriomyces hyalinus]|nr:hypothetical protein HDU77_011769 [Chytriomyces hyalinus]
MLSATEAKALLSISAALTSNSEPITPTAIEASAASTTAATPSTTTETTMETNLHQYIIPTAILASTALLILLAILCKRLHTSRLRKNNNKSNNSTTTISQTPDSRFSRTSLLDGSSMASTPSLRNTDLESILAYTSRTASQKRTPCILPTHRSITSNLPRETDNSTQRRQSAATNSDETDNESYDVAFTSSETSKRASVETVLTISEVSDYAVYFDYTKQ